MVPRIPHTTWRKSSRSTQNGSCVELAPASAAIAVRDSKDPAGGHLSFSHREWAAFTARIKNTP